MGKAFRVQWFRVAGLRPVGSSFLLGCWFFKGGHPTLWLVASKRKTCGVHAAFCDSDSLDRSALGDAIQLLDANSANVEKTHHSIQVSLDHDSWFLEWILFPVRARAQGVFVQLVAF